MDNLIELGSYPVRLVLPILLQDRTTNENIIWATDTYEAYGNKYKASCNMQPSLVLNDHIIQPRIAKAADDQMNRTKKHAEVFTPAWICNLMINHCDEVWFGRKDVFNRTEGHSWVPTETPITFPKRKRWQQYIDSRRLEITCGEAPYLVSRYDASTGTIIPISQRIGILDRKLRIVNENAADEAEWWKYIYRAFESVYGYEYQGDNLLIARANLLLTFAEAVQEKWQRDATEVELRRAADIISWNIWQMDGLKGSVPFGSLAEANAQMTFIDLGNLDQLNIKLQECDNPRPQCLIYDWRGQGKLKYNDRKTRKGNEMKFDFAIGNPPYQEEAPGNSTSDKPVYHLFMDAVNSVAAKTLLITPARFLFNAGATPKEWNKKMLESRHFQVLHYEQNANVIFPNNAITGGIAITYHDTTTETDPIQVFIPYPELTRIRQKVVKSTGYAAISQIISGRTPYLFTDALHLEHPDCQNLLSKGHLYDISSNAFGSLPNIFLSETPNDEHLYFRVLGRFENKRAYRWILKKYARERAISSIGKWKVFLPKANGASGMLGAEPARLISKPVIGQPDDIATDTFICVGSFDSMQEANAALKYITSKFARALLGTLKVTQINSKETWANVPLQDFTSKSDIDWSASPAEIDQQLYRKYTLTHEEISFIEFHVKELE